MKQGEGSPSLSRMQPLNSKGSAGIRTSPLGNCRSTGLKWVPLVGAGTNASSSEEEQGTYMVFKYKYLLTIHSNLPLGALGLVSVNTSQREMLAPCASWQAAPTRTKCHRYSFHIRIAYSEPNHKERADRENFGDVLKGTDLLTSSMSNSWKPKKSWGTVLDGRLRTLSPMCWKVTKAMTETSDNTWWTTDQIILTNTVLPDFEKCATVL